MLKKLTALLLAMIMLLSFTACKEKVGESAEANSEVKSAIVKAALEAIEDGDIDGAYDILYNLKDRTEEEQELFERFAFVPVSETKTEDGQIVSIVQCAYNEDGYLLSRNVSNVQYGASYTINEIATYDNNNLLTYNYTYSDGESYKVVHIYDENGNMLSSKYGEHVTEEFTYHSNGEMATYTYKTPDNAAELYGIYGPQLYTATYDQNGNILSEKTVRNNTGDKSTSETVYTYDAKGNLLTADTTRNDGYWVKDFNVYDQNGNRLTHNVSNSDGYIESEICTYDEKNRVLTTQKTDKDGTFKKTYTYDENDNVLTEEGISDNGHKSKIVYTYDKNGNLLTGDPTNPDCDCCFKLAKEIYTYDKSGNILTYESYIGDYWWKDAYTYDDNGNKLTYDYTTSDGRYIKEISTYDNKDRLLTYQKTTNDNSEFESYTYDEQDNKIYERAGWTITCDKYGNVIKEHLPASDGTDNPFGLALTTPEQTIIRTYELIYYPNGAPQVTAAHNTPLSNTPRTLHSVTDLISGKVEHLRTSNFYYYSNIY